MKYSKLKKKLQVRYFVETLLYSYAEQETQNEHFHKFKCEQAFVGKTMADLNYHTYCINRRHIERKIKQIQTILRRLK